MPAATAALGLGFRSGGGDTRRRVTKKERRRRDSGSSIAAAADVVGGGGAGRRRSFGSEIDVVFSSLSPNLELCQSHMANPAQNQTTNRPHTHSSESEDDETLDPAKQSFSIAVRECQTRRFRSEGITSPVTVISRRRPASVDLNGPLTIDVSAHSPRFLPGGVRGTNKVSASAATSRSRSGVFQSPMTPNYRNGGAMSYQKGWSSERVPLPVNSSRRYIGGGGSALHPFNNGRALPSKWDDAEKWICSPVSGDGSGRPLVPPPHHRRPKSKSGPLGPMAGINGGAYSAAASPLMPCYDNGRIGNFAAESPFMAGVLVPDRGFCGGYSSAGSGGGGGSIGSVGIEGGRRSFSANADPYIGRSASVHGWSDLIESSSSVLSSQGTLKDEKHDSCREAAISISPVVFRKDVATQMSPEGSTNSSPRECPSHASPSVQPIEELDGHFSKTDVRDVQVDDQVTMTRWSKRHMARASDKQSTKAMERKKKSGEAKDSAWGVAETTKCISMYKREEAKITAWENLQKAKAEAEIRKLEMKLEKKRSSSMDKILNKLRYAQQKAQDMRSAASTTQAHEVSFNQSHEVNRTHKKLSYFRRTVQMRSFAGCFTCPAS